jgi:hypothetical protein
MTPSPHPHQVQPRPVPASQRPSLVFFLLPPPFSLRLVYLPPQPPVPAAGVPAESRIPRSSLSPDRQYRQSTRPPLPSHSSAFPSKLLVPRYLYPPPKAAPPPTKQPPGKDVSLLPHTRACHAHSLPLRQACQVRHTIQYSPHPSTYFVITPSQMATLCSIVTLTWMLTNPRLAFHAQMTARVQTTACAPNIWLHLPIPHHASTTNLHPNTPNNCLCFVVLSKELLHIADHLLGHLHARKVST